MMRMHTVVHRQILSAVSHVRWSTLIVCVLFVLLSLGHQTCNLYVAASSPALAPLQVALGKLLTPVCLCHQAV